LLNIQFATDTKPGAPHNEDLFGFKGDTFWLLDGATSTDGPPLDRDAYWLVHEMDTMLDTLWELDLSMADAAAQACTRLSDRWPTLSSNRPVAALALWRIRDNKLEAAITGNVSLVVCRHGEAVELTDTRILPAQRGASDALLKALARGVSFESEEFRTLRRKMKRKEAEALDINAKGWLVSAAERRPEDFLSFELDLPEQVTVFAATDGFMELRRYLGQPELLSFVEQVKSMSLTKAIEHIRLCEEHPESGRRFPRTKRHDDVTAVLLKYF
jgi:hypothetical protein